MKHQFEISIATKVKQLRWPIDEWFQGKLILYVFLWTFHLDALSNLESVNAVSLGKANDFVLRADAPPQHTLNYYYGDYYASQQCLYLLTSAWTTFFDHLIASWKLQAYQLPLLSNTETDLLYNSCQFVPEWLLLLLNLPCWSQSHLYFHCFLALCHSYLNFLFDEKL